MSVRFDEPSADEGRRLIEAFRQIKHGAQRARLIAVAERLAAEELPEMDPNLWETESSTP